MIGIRPFRPASGAISKNPAAKCELKYKAAVRGGFAPGPGCAIGSGVRSGFGGGDVLPSRRARREARVEQREQAFAAPLPPVPSERPFDELPVQVLAPESVQDAEAPALEVREHAVDPLQDLMRRPVSDRHRRVVLQPVVAGPAVGRDPRSRIGRVFEERFQRRAGLVHGPAELGAPGTVLPEHLDRRSSAGPRGCARPADLVHQHPGRLVAPQTQMVLELQGRHPVRMRSHDVEGPMPAPQQHVRAVHERPVTTRLKLPKSAEVKFPSPGKRSRPTSGGGTDPPRTPRRSGTSARTDRRTAYSEIRIDSSCAAYGMNMQGTSSAQTHKMQTLRIQVNKPLKQNFAENTINPKCKRLMLIMIFERLCFGDAERNRRLSCRRTRLITRRTHGSPSEQSPSTSLSIATR